MGKTAVMALLRCHGSKGHSEAIAHVVADIGQNTLHGKIREAVAPCSIVITEHAGYDGLGEYEHKVINHADTQRPT